MGKTALNADGGAVGSEAESGDATAAVSASPIVAQEITLNEFCTRRSVNDRRVELIGAFHYSEKSAGSVKATEAVWTARFEEFVNKPV